MGAFCRAISESMMPLVFIPERMPSKLMPDPLVELIAMGVYTSCTDDRHERAAHEHLFGGV